MSTISLSFLKIILILIMNFYFLNAADNSQSIIEIMDGAKVLSKEYITIEKANINRIAERQSGFKQVGKLCYGNTIEKIYQECMINLKNYNKYWV